MWQVPERFWVTSGVAEGGTELNAFDNGLLAAGIGNLNLIRVSSVLPRGAVREYSRPTKFPEGTLMPMVYSVAESDKEGDLIASCVGIGRARDSFGMIFEHSGLMSAAHAEATVRQQLEEAFQMRGMTLDEVIIESCELKVQRCGCTVAAVMLW